MAFSGHGRRESLQMASSLYSADSVKVLVRVRPELGTRAGARFQRIVVHPINDTTLQIDSGAAASPGIGSLKGTGTKFTFDRVIGPDEGQEDVYQEVIPLVDAFVQGMNVTVLAYGQTSSGKSYTMGTDRTTDMEDVREDERLGITPRAVAEIFKRLQQAQVESRGASSFKVKLSYIEIYNEDLIDLLAGEHDVRPQVQIREDHGRILWSGLREVTVNSASEVMNHLTAGSALRQTNATDMNAQSSRSHAIFSLTVEQKKYTGSGSPPSPNHSRMHSRTSMLPRVSSPTPSSPSRSSTPTNDRRIPGLRPPSQLARPGTPDDDRSASNGVDSWTSITSKFHFVDLAGSERLKRTAAAGERVKEGISINSGLHALGNVISALGDPTKRSTHIPYRDSKLTRLLQDSLGGNAKTMMVACVSPTELNLHETLSTVKYAHRARNIKNRAEINEVEVGWDDVDYLQRTITKLRAELASVKNGDMSAITEENGRHSFDLDHNNGSSDIGLRQQYSELQQKHAQLTADLATAQSGAAAISSTSLSREEFAAAIEPVVEEYEKSLSALESQLSLTRAALGHSEDEMKELEARVEEEVKANEANGALIDELKSRISKLGEREATVEQYVRDLEAKLKDYGDQDESHGSAVSDLRKEITKSREQSEKTEQYVADLEARLAKSDDVNASLRRHIDVLERDVQRREETYKELESRLAVLDTSGDHKLLLAEIDEKDRRVLDLERSLDELRLQTTTAESEQQRLQKLAAEEREAKEELQSRVRTLERASVVLSPSKVRHEPLTPRTPGDGAANGDEGTSVVARDSVMITALEHQLATLQRNHDNTLAELEAANAKYRDSLKEIAELSAQSQEARLGSSLTGSNPPSPSADSPSQSRSGGGDLNTDGEDELDELASSASPTRRTPKTRRSMPLAPSHRLSFLGRGQGAPAHTHARSASLSQELSLAVLSQASSPPTYSNPQSPQLTSSPIPPSVSRESIYGNLLSSSQSARSYEQMKEEVMKLQTALSEREEEIAVLEASLQHHRTPVGSPHGSPMPRSLAARRRSTSASPDTSNVPTFDGGLFSPKTRAAFEAFAITDDDVPNGVASTARLEDLMRAMARKETAHRDTVEQLQSELSTLGRQHDELTIVSRDQVDNASSEIDRLRRDLDQRPEASHYEQQLKAMRDELDEAGVKVETARREAETRSDEALVQLRQEHASEITRIGEEHRKLLEAALADRDAELKQKEEEHAAALASRTAMYQEELRLQLSGLERDLSDEVDDLGALLQRKDTEIEEAAAAFESEREELKKRHEEAVRQLDATKAEHANTLQNRDDAHADTLEKLQLDHEETLASRTREHETAVAELAQKHSAALGEASSARDFSLTGLKNEHTSVLASLAASHAAALASSQADFDTRSRETLDGHQSAVEALRAEHDEALAKLKSSHEEELTRRVNDLEEKNAAALDLAKQEHNQNEQTLEAEHEAALCSLREEHGSTLRQLEEKHREALAAQRKELDEWHDGQRRGLAEDHERQRQNLIDERDAASRGARESQEAALTGLRAEHVSAVDELKQMHEQALSNQQNTHANSLESAESTHREELDRAVADRQKAVEAHAALQAEHDALKAQLEQSRSAETVLSTDRDELRQTHARALEEQQMAHVSALESAASTHRQELDQLEAKRQEAQDARDALQAELEHIKLTATALSTDRDEAQRGLDEMRQAHERAMADQQSAHAAALDTASSTHRQELGRAEAARQEVHDAHAALQTKYDALQAELESSKSAATALTTENEEVQRSLDETKRAHEETLSGLKSAHSSAMESANAIHREELARAEAGRLEVQDARDALQAELERIKAEVAILSTDREQAQRGLDELKQTHETATSSHQSELGVLMQKLATLEASLSSRDAEEKSTRQELTTLKATSLDTETALQQARSEHENLAARIKELEQSVESTEADAGKLRDELERYKSTSTKLETELAQVQQDRDALRGQLKRFSAGQRSNSSHGSPDPGADVGTTSTANGDRALSRTNTSDVNHASPSTQRRDSRLSLNGGKSAPPPTPPPSMPPPPLPMSLPALPSQNGSTPTRGSVNRASSSGSLGAGRNSIGSVGFVDGGSSKTDANGMDPRMSRKFEEHEQQISRLTKQLTHCEADLQANIDLVNTLESALNDSERNLRKARTQMSDMARERDSYIGQNEALRQQVQDAYSEVETVRHSVIDAENRLQEERASWVKERARLDLLSTLDRADNRKGKSKFNCF